MFLQAEAEKLTQLLKESSVAEECDIFMAYPFITKPTRLKRPVIAVSPSALEADTISLGEGQFFGEYRLEADIFVPQDQGAPQAAAVAERVICAAAALMPCKIYISPVTAEDHIGCFRAKCTLTFSASICLGGTKNG